MQVHPIYRATEEIKTYSLPSDSIFSIQQVDKLFDRAWCEQIMDTISGDPTQVRRFYATGKEIGNTMSPTIKYYIQFC